MTENARPIVTTYYKDLEATKVVKTNRAAHANSAVLRCVDHMQLNHYKARLCEVYDERDSKLHAVVVRELAGEIHIAYKRPVKEGM